MGHTRCSPLSRAHSPSLAKMRVSAHGQKIRATPTRELALSMHDLVAAISPTSSICAVSTTSGRVEESTVKNSRFFVAPGHEPIPKGLACAVRCAPYHLVLMAQPRPASLGSRTVLFKHSSPPVTCADGGDRFEHCSRLPLRRDPPSTAQSHQSTHRFSQMWQFMFCLFLIFILSFPARVSSSIVCAHANSTFSDCASLCGVARVFSLLPSPCHPDFPPVS